MAGAYCSLLINIGIHVMAVYTVTPIFELISASFTYGPATDGVGKSCMLPCSLRRWFDPP